MNKKILFITLGITITLIAAVLITYFVSLTPVSSKYEEVKFTIKNGESKQEIVKNLKQANLIKSKYGALIYIVLSGRNNLQAGSYVLNRNMSTREIISSLHTGDVVNQKKPTVSITFKEGLTLKEYLALIADKTNLNYDDIIKEINDEEFLKDLVDNYWFLTEDILDKDIYYALEGYLFPETYSFYEETNLKEVIKRLLNETDKKLSPLKDDITSTGLSVHDVLTMASIIEKEANSKEDREMVSQVIYKRLEKNMSLGMDVTAYYGVQKALKEEISSSDLNNSNPYNTRITTFKGLPIGPICNPGIISIKAAINPADTNYLYFVADKTGKVHFTDNEKEFNEFKRLYL